MNQNRRKNIKYRLNEQKRSTASRNDRRQDKKYRQIEQVSNTASHIVRRENTKFREIEQKRNTVAHIVRRQNTKFREIEQKGNTAAHVVCRQDKKYRESEQKYNTVAHQNCKVNFRSDWILLESKYRTEIQECADNVCASCGGLFYKKSGQLAEGDFARCAINLITNVSSYMQNGRMWFCFTCIKSLKKKKIPLLCLQNGFQFLQVPKILKCLTPLEEMLVALRLPFMQI
jgi:hypothetical protein